ncbi:MAG: hypothetical protein NT161_00585 [Candidatus Nomurabacteria bacterium]|nr:hypothetical protein [Candidatus Nomurabacteria bacterium]
MKKNIIKILIITLLLAPFITRATLPIFVDDGGSGSGSGSGIGSSGGPSGYTFCANEDQNLFNINPIRCNFSGTRDVAYGANGIFVYMRNVTNGIDCSNRTFGDPIFGVVKACYIKNVDAVDANPDLFVKTNDANNITQSTATLHGEGGYSSSVSNSSSNGVWNSKDGGKTGTWSTATDSGTWVSNLLAGQYLLGAPGGTGTATWTGTGNGTGTWKSGALLSGSGTWTNGKGTGGTGTGTWASETNATISSPSITAYFRYAKAKNNPPIFCNDIYGSNMISTKDIKPGYYKSFSKDIKLNDNKSFAIDIDNLSPNSTYYYCAILSNKNTIAYGGNSVVKEFHTNCYETTVETKSPATNNIRSTSASLAGAYCSAKTIANETEKIIKEVTTSLEYINTTCPKGWTGWPICKDSKSSGICPKGWTGVWPECTAVWTTVGKQTYNMDNYANLYGEIKSNLTELSPDTRYKFRAMVETINSIKEIKTTKGADIYFTTTPSSGGGDTGGSGKTGTCAYGGTYPECNANPANNICSNGATNYPDCNNNTNCQPGGTCNNNICSNGATDYPTCNNNTNCPPGSACFNNNPNNPNPPTPTFCKTNPTDSSCLNDPYNPNSRNNPYNLNNPHYVPNPNNFNDPYNPNSFFNPYNQNYNSNNNQNNNSPIITTPNTTPLVLGQTISPPEMDVVRYHEGIETVFTRQIIADTVFAKIYGYADGMNLQTFAWDLADQFARAFGYINSSGKEIRVSLPDVAAYQLLLVGNKLTVYEYYANKIVDIRNVTTVFKNASGYEYYFKK